MYCIRCGSRLPRGAGFCSRCGAPVVTSFESGAVPSDAAVGYVPHTKMPSPRAVRRGKTMRWYRFLKCFYLPFCSILLMLAASLGFVIRFAASLFGGNAPVKAFESVVTSCRAHMPCFVFGILLALLAILISKVGFGAFEALKEYAQDAGKCTVFFFVFQFVFTVMFVVLIAVCGTTPFGNGLLYTPFFAALPPFIGLLAAGTLIGVLYLIAAVGSHRYFKARAARFTA